MVRDNCLPFEYCFVWDIDDVVGRDCWDSKFTVDGLSSAIW